MPSLEGEILLTKTITNTNVTDSRTKTLNSIDVDAEYTYFWISFSRSGDLADQMVYERARSHFKSFKRAHVRQKMLYRHVTNNVSFLQIATKTEEGAKLTRPSIGCPP